MDNSYLQNTIPVSQFKCEPENDVDPLEGSSYLFKSEIKDEDDCEDNGYNSMALLELAQCMQTNHGNIEFDLTEAAVNPKTGTMVCLHCYADLDSNLLMDHMVNAHNYGQMLFKCHICGTTFQERKLLGIHRQDCRPPPKKPNRRTFQQMIREVEIKMEGSDYDTITCPICVLEMDKTALKDHMMTEHSTPDLVFTCAKCNKNYKSRLTLREHVRLVHEAVEDSVECELCGQKFRSFKYLSNHKRNVHPTGNKVHECATCGKQFKSRLCLHQHSKYVHPPQSASAECTQCHKVFKSRINLQQHIKVSHKKTATTSDEAVSQ